MSTPAMPWEEAAQQKPPWEEAQGAAIPPGAKNYAAGSIAPPLTSHWEATKYGLGELGGGIADVGKGLWGMVKPPTMEEAQQAFTESPTMVPIDILGRRVGRGLKDLGGQAMQVPGAVRDLYHSRDPLGSLALTAPRAAGQGVGNIAPAIAEAVAPRVVPPAVRAVAKGTNAALAKAPGTIGGMVGGGLGGYLAGRTGAELGGAAGALAGRELLPRLRVPGEHFGYPNRIAGGPAAVPPWEPPTTPVTSAPPVTPPPVAPVPESAAGTLIRSVAEPPTNMPTAASRAASDAAFAKLHPNEEMPETMTPDAVRAWQESAGFKAEPAEDIGAKVRSQMPALPRGAKPQPAAPGEVSWPPNFKPSTIQRPARLDIATPQDVLETKAIQERVRDAAEREDQARLSREKREWFARNAPGKTKGELIQETKPSQGPEWSDITKDQWNDAYTSEYRRLTGKEPDAKTLDRIRDQARESVSLKRDDAIKTAQRQASGRGGELWQPTARGQKPEVAAPETDLTESWSRALEDLKAKRGKKPSKGE